MSVVLFRCVACGVTYQIDHEVDGPQLCNECNKTIYNYELKPREDIKCSKDKDSK